MSGEMRAYLAGLGMAAAGVGLTVAAVVIFDDWPLEAVVLMVAGGALVFAASPYGKRESRLQREARARARGILAWWREQNADQEYLVAPETALESVEKELFATIQPQFEALGCRYLADIVNTTAYSSYGSARRIHRNLLSADGTIRVTIDQWLCTKDAKPQDAGVSFETIDKRILLTTELSDGQFVVTFQPLEPASSSELAYPKIPGIEEQRAPSEESVSALLERHASRVRKALAADSALRPRALRTTADVLDSLRRMQARINEHYRVDGTAFEAIVERLVAASPDKRARRLLPLIKRELITLLSCPQCGYRLTGNTSGICPECGTPH